ncbi:MULTISPECIES: hypothetical protein [Amycolatopsis]|nr:hypothetical protein [Amycolatopsis sp. CB00013]
MDTESAKSFYAGTLPNLGYADTHNANEQTGSARVTITKSDG